MPPKKQDNAPKKKVTVDDKTFGMKNKKGAKAQTTIKQLEASHKSNLSAEEKRKQALRDQKEKEKAAAEAAKKEAAELFKPVQAQKVPFGVDPKTVVCEFFKKGGCEKGKKCKFSHDLDAGRKMHKKDLYVDQRQAEKEEKEQDRMDDWDEDKLQKVILSKHGNPKTTTDKVCKYFIQAIEESKYGWFWTCPNGGEKCMYKHSLPPGFVIKTKEQRAAEKALMDKSPLSTLTLEDFLEAERHKLFGNLTPVTPESFAKWKKERMDKKEAEKAAMAAREATGRALFESGNWKADSDAESEDDEDEKDEQDQRWNLEAMRKETERLQLAREEERLKRGYAGDERGESAEVSAAPSVNGDTTAEGEG